MFKFNEIQQQTKDEDEDDRATVQDWMYSYDVARNTATVLMMFRRRLLMSLLQMTSHCSSEFSTTNFACSSRCCLTRLSIVINDAHANTTDGNIVFRVKKLLFVMQSLGIWRIIGTGVKICGRKCHIWNRWPWFAYSLCNFYGATMMIKGSLLLSAPIVKHFRSTLVRYS